MIKHFKDLMAWQESHKLVLSVYKATKLFPADERFALADQIRRCVVSVTSNIAEGFGRNSGRDKLQFYAISRGSLFELESQLLIARDLDYISGEIFKNLECQINFVSRLISGIIKTAPTKDVG
ncbi:MAG: four helix bundle protein [Patescibacteria group bacterium]